MRLARSALCVLLLACGAGGCGNDPVLATPWAEILGAPSAVRLTEVPLVTASLRCRGVALVDYDDDGDVDITAAHRDGVLLLQNEGGVFTPDQRLSAGPTNANAVVWADVDDDGDLDLLVTRSSLEDEAAIPEPLSVALYRAEDGALTNVTSAAGLTAEGYWQGATFGDLDEDGDLDLIVMGGPRPVPDHQTQLGFNGSANRFWRNKGDGTFEDMTSTIGCTGADDGEGWGAQLLDFDRDGRLDMFLTNDFRGDTLCRNEGSGVFSDVSHKRLDLQGETGAMGTAIGDLDGDGCPELYSTNFGRDLVYSATFGGPLVNSYTTAFDGVRDTSVARSGWGVAAFDVDLDGDQDVMTVSAFDAPIGHSSDAVSIGGASFYENRSGRIADSIIDVGDEVNDLFTEPMHGYGLAVADIDGDGDQDVLLGLTETLPSQYDTALGEGLPAGPMLLRNDSGGDNHWLALTLAQPAPNARAVGAVVTVSVGGRQAIGMVTAGTSFLSAHSYTLHFGLGGATAPDWVRVVWPGGATQVFLGVEAGAFTVQRSDAPCVPPGACDDVPAVQGCLSDVLLADIAACSALCEKLAACGWTDYGGIPDSEPCGTLCVDRPFSVARTQCLMAAECSADPIHACAP